MTAPIAAGCMAGHGAVPRGLDSNGSSQPTHGRFGKLFTDLHKQDLTAAAQRTLLDVIKASGSGENSKIPAGYTYLAQFVDHDLTFDPTPQGTRVKDPHALKNFRTPQLDLDSLYGTGPSDQPYLYETDDSPDARVKLLTGRSFRGMLGQTKPDLPRNNDDRALIGDPRNDESVIISQLHLLFIGFHNKIVDRLRGQSDLNGDDLFRAARRIVTWHYQWIVVHDLLRLLVGKEMLTSVLRKREHFNADGDPFIPVEFAGAAFRFGHSMVRDSYAINGGKNAPIFALEDKPARTQHLGGFRRLPIGLVIDWGLFFELTPDKPRAQLSHLIDANVTPPLWLLPTQISGKREPLPLLNLRRASMLDVPPGPLVATAMGAKRLNAQQLKLDNNRISDTIRAELMAKTPLWYYILREADALHGGECLGPVGGRIVAETIIGLLVSDPESYLAQDPTWTPEDPGKNKIPGVERPVSSMADLVRFVQAT